MDTEIQILRERFAQMADEELFRIIDEEASDYRPEAIQVAREEIGRRGLDPTRVKAPAPADTARSEAEDDIEAEVETEEPPLSSLERFTCAACGHALRSAVLLADNQIIAVFEDNREARFVKLLVCPRCGTADMLVDMHTEVEE